MSWIDMLLKRAPNTIRRFHATRTQHLPSIIKEGLVPMDPGTPWAPGTGTGVYTSVYPDYFHEMPGDAVIAIDIPKDAYRQMYRLPHNPETPPARYGMGTTARGHGTDYTERYIVDTINDKGRVDIFGQDILKPEWFTDIMYVGPDYNIYRYKPQSQTKMLDWDVLDSPELETQIRPFKTADEFITTSDWKPK